MSRKLCSTLVPIPKCTAASIYPNQIHLIKPPYRNLLKRRRTTTVTDSRKTLKPYADVDGYLLNFSGKTRDNLETLRHLIKKLEPESGEKISYGIPTFTLDGKYFIYIAGYEKHVSMYPIPPGDEAFEKELAPYVAGKGTVRFSLDKPLPLALIRKMVKFAVKQRLEKTY